MYKVIMKKNNEAEGTWLHNKRTVTQILRHLKGYALTNNA